MLRVGLTRRFNRPGQNPCSVIEREKSRSMCPGINAVGIPIEAMSMLRHLLADSCR
jgi:hypothetical protein